MEALWALIICYTDFSCFVSLVLQFIHRLDFNDWKVKVSILIWEKIKDRRESFYGSFNEYLSNNDERMPFKHMLVMGVKMLF